MDLVIHNLVITKKKKKSSSKNTYFDVDLRVHLPQVVHDTVQVELSCS